jgi:amino acid adenylation domain-containing protein
MLTAAEKQKLLVDFNNTSTQVPLLHTVLQLFEEQVLMNADAIALQYENRKITYGQLNRQANRLAHHLRRLGIGPEKVVALCIDRSPEVIIAILGVLKAGGGYLPLDVSLPPQRLEFMLEETSSSVILTTGKLADKIPETKAAILCLDVNWPVLEAESGDNLPLIAGPNGLAYIIYTSGSTGRPKGTLVQHSNLLNYIIWARDFYLQGEKLVFPLFSPLSFDLTVTSIFVPLVSGGSIVIYDESETPGLEVLDVIRENRVDIIKLTPAHLTLLQAGNLRSERLRKMIVGGEDFKRSLAQGIYDLFDGLIEIYNEYGPTETTVGCMIHRFDPARDKESSVPIGQPIHNSQIYILDKHLLPVPPGVIGEMCIGGASVARGYLQRSELTGSKSVSDPFQPGGTLYRTGDLARWTPDGQMQFLGRSDHQVKIKGYRIELGEIENNLLDHPDIKSAVVTAFQPVVHSADVIKRWCVECGLPDNYPDTEFDSAGVCNTCREFSELRARFRSYFKTPAELHKIADHARQAKTSEYDCIVLYSGGKDSTYMLYKLVKEYGLRPLVFSLDNGYISEEAKENMRRVTEALGVDLVFGQTPHMNVIFADSLKRHSNVCNGCYKVIYTLSINMARQKGIRYIFTGLSRGQLFETRLSDMFQARIFDDVAIDRTVLAARKAYHRFEDAVTQLMDVKVFEDDNIFDDIQLVDFYRYVDVPLQQMYTYLEQNAPWIRPSDTGRSTNCLINDVGIYIHKRERGFHNYALPYSWDVRMGHKTRAEAIDELNDDIDEKKVHRIMDEIGYEETESGGALVAAYFVARRPVTSTEVRAYLENSLPSYMIPSFIIQLDQIPLTPNGKIDREVLPRPESRRMVFDKVFVAPETSLEQQLADIWSEVLHVKQIGVHDNFFELGGDSISTIHVMMRVSQIFKVNLRPVTLFEMPTISGLAGRIEKILIEEIEKLTEEEARSLLEEDELKRGGGQ